MDFLTTALAVAFVVGILDALDLWWWARFRPWGAVTVSAALTGCWHATDLREAVVLVLGTSFAGLALPSLLDAAMTRSVQLTRQRPRL